MEEYPNYYPDFEIDLETFDCSLEEFCSHCKHRKKCHPTHLCKLAIDVYFAHDYLEE